MSPVDVVASQVSLPEDFGTSISPVDDFVVNILSERSVASMSPVLVFNVSFGASQFFNSISPVLDLTEINCDEITFLRFISPVLPDNFSFPLQVTEVSVISPVDTEKSIFSTNFAILSLLLLQIAK